MDTFLRRASDMETSRAYQIIVAGSILTAIAAFGIFARVLSARMIKRPYDLGDVLVILSFSLNCLNFGVITWATQRGGLGRHVITTTPEENSNFGKAYLTSSIIQPTSLMLAKMSVLLMLYKIFIVRTFRVAVVVFMVLVIGWWFAVTIALFFICRPLRAFWEQQAGNCGNLHLFDATGPIAWIVTDFAMLFMPMPMIKRLNLPLRQKIALAGLFLIGGLTCIISCIRLKQVYFSLEDITWDATGLAIWQLAEVNVTMLCACLVASRPFAMLLIPDFLVKSIRSAVDSIQSFISARTPRSSRKSSMVDLRKQNTATSRQKNVAVDVGSVSHQEQV